MNLLKKIINFFLSISNYSLVRIPSNSSEYSLIEPTSTYSPWNTDHNFQLIFKKIKNHTLVDLYRLYSLNEIVSQTKKLPEGDYLEVGVWRGGSAGIILSKIQDQSSTLHLCDTFKGVVKSTEKDPFYKDGDHSDTSEDTVNLLLRNLDLKNYEIHKGSFPDQTGYAIQDKVFRFCHIDVDVYQSAKEIWDWINPKLVSRGIVIFDDYGFAGCVGVRDFVNEIKTHPDFYFIHHLSGQAIFIKR